MKQYLILLLAAVSFCCRHAEKPEMHSIKKDGLTIRGYFIQDTILNDTVYFYDGDNRLISQEVYDRGVRNGLSVDFHPNRVPKTVSNFASGVLNGSNKYYDSSGVCFYQDYFFHGLAVGPIVYFAPNGSPNRFFFVSLENRTLLDIDYRTWTGIGSIVKDCIVFTQHELNIDTLTKLNLLLYVMKPPRLMFSYSIVKRRGSGSDDYQDVKMVDSDLPFKQLVLPLPDSNEHYSVRLEVYDSMLQKRSIIFKDI